MPAQPVANSPHAVRVLVVDSDDVRRLGYGVLLKNQPWVAECSVARDPAEAAALARRQGPDVALVDISHDPGSGETITGLLRQARPEIEVVLTARCTCHSDATPPDDAIAYLPPGTPSTDVLRTLLQAAVVPHELQRRQEERRAQAAGGLNERERAVFQRLLRGDTFIAISTELRLSQQSTRKAASLIFSKLGVAGIEEARAMVTEGLVSPW